MVDGRVIFITGASSGLGLLTSVELARKGNQVIAAIRDLHRKVELVKLAQQHDVSDRMELVQLDVSDEEQVFRVIDEVLNKYQKIDVLINNAGVAVNGFVEELPLEKWRETFDTNFYGALACTKAVLPQMRERKSGYIINISSVAGRMGQPMWGPYVASKFALEGFSETLQQEVEEFGINVSIIEPTPFKSKAEEKRQKNFFLYENSPYTEQANRINEQFKQIVQHSMETIEVVQVIEDVLSEEKPKLRYPVGIIMDFHEKDIQPT